MTGKVEPVGFENWQRLILEMTQPGGRVRSALGTTAIYVSVALVVEFVLGLAIAVLFNSGIWAAGFWQALMILPMVVPPTVAAVMFKVLENADYGALAYYLQRIGITDKVEPLLGGTGRFALPAVLIPDIWQWTPFFVLILLAGLKALPTEPLEASQVDGATSWQSYWFVTLPMLRPMIAVAVLFRLVDLLKVFDYVFVLTSGGPGSEVKTTSHASASARGESFHTAPLARCGAALSRRRSWTQRLCPAPWRFSAMLPPIKPSPMNPTFM